MVVAICDPKFSIFITTLHLHFKQAREGSFLRCLSSSRRLLSDVMWERGTMTDRIIRRRASRPLLFNPCRELPVLQVVHELQALAASRKPPVSIVARESSPGKPSSENLQKRACGPPWPAGESSWPAPAMTKTVICAETKRDERSHIASGQDPLHTAAHGATSQPSSHPSKATRQKRHSFVTSNMY